jgi:phosphohistidine phosphatase SixA
MLLKKHGGWPAPKICDELKDGAPEVVLQALQPYRSLGSVAIVGHEPYLSRFISQVLSPSAGVTVELKKGAAACLELSDPEMRGDSRLLWLLQPRALRGLA